MRIALICTEKLPSPAISGGAIQIMIDGVISFLAKNHQVTVFSITDPHLPEYEMKGSITYLRFPKEQYAMKVAEALKQSNFDVIHVFNRPKNMLLYRDAAKNSAFVLSLHNDMFSELKIDRKTSLQVIQHTEVIMTVSQYIKRTVSGRFPEAEQKLKVLYSGVDLSKFEPAWSSEGQKIRDQMRRKYGVENKKVILFVGRLSQTKGPHILIESLEYLIAHHPEIVLVIAGGRWFSDNTVDNYVQSLYDLAKPYHSHVVFTQYIPSNEIPSLLTMGDAFVCSSQWHEPLARVHYEAMAAGVPIITSNRGGNSEVIDQDVSGIIIHDYENPVAYARAINTILNEQDFGLSIAKKGREKVEKDHQYHHVASRLEEAYEQALRSFYMKNSIGNRKSGFI